MNKMNQSDETNTKETVRERELELELVAESSGFPVRSGIKGGGNPWGLVVGGSTKGKLP